MNCNSRYKIGSVFIGLQKSLLSWQRIVKRFLVMLACKLGVRLLRNRLSCFWKYKLSSLEEMNAWIKFCCSTGMPIVRIAVFAEVIFFSRVIFRAPSSLTKTANSPKRFANMIAPKPLKNEPMAICGTPRGYRSLPMRNRQDVYVHIQYWW